jgi:DNA-binding transcriptional ArsR family regulator
MPPRTKTRTQAKGQRPSQVDPRLLKAVGHPLRFRLLLAYNEGKASPNELAKALAEPLANVAYHTRVLLDAGAIELVDTAQRRGATEHYYSAVIRPYLTGADSKALPSRTRQALFLAAVQTILADISSAAAGSGFEHPAAHASRTRLELDDQGFSDVVALLSDVLERLIEIQAESANRWAANGLGGPPPLATEVTITHFHRSEVAGTDV